MPEHEKTPEELREEQKARGDFVEEIDEEEVDDDDEEEVDDADEEEEADDAAADDEEVDDEPGAKPDDSIMVPKGRLDEALHKARQREQELQARLDAAQDHKAKETTSVSASAMEQELDALDDKYAELLLEGELEKASAVRKQWRQKQSELFDARLEQRSTAASRDAVDSMRFDRQLAEYEVKFPVINPDSDEFQQEVAEEVLDLMDAFRAKGLNHVAALNKAVRYVIREDAAPATTNGNADDLRNKRRTTARRKVADVARQSPPDITDKGRDTDKVGTGDGLPDVTKMTPEQFSKLSEKQLRKLREDTITNQETA